MPVQNTIDGDLRIKGKCKPDALDIPNSTIDDDAVAPDAGIDASKLDHEFRPVYQQEASANAAAETRDFYISRGAGEIVDVDVWLVTPPDTASGSGGRTAMVDLKVNNVSVLSATVTLNSTNVSRVAVAGTIATAAYAANAVFSAVVTLGAGSTGTHAKGVAMAVTVREAAA